MKGTKFETKMCGNFSNEFHKMNKLQTKTQEKPNNTLIFFL